MSSVSHTGLCPILSTVAVQALSPFYTGDEQGLSGPNRRVRVTDFLLMEEERNFLFHLYLGIVKVVNNIKLTI